VTFVSEIGLVDAISELLPEFQGDAPDDEPLPPEGRGARSARAADDAEFVALGVGEDNERVLRVLANPPTGGTQRLDLSGGRVLVLRGEIDVDAILHDLALGDLETDPGAPIRRADRTSNRRPRDRARTP
jgi:hypothetical protein